MSHPHRALAGHPVLLEYVWRTGPGFKPPEHRVLAFVHVVDEDGARLAADDHAPEPSPRDWVANQTYRYSRLVFLPVLFRGALEIRAGLYEPGTNTRWMLRGEEAGHASFKVGSLVSLPNDELRPPELGQGWSEPGYDPGRPFETPHDMLGPGLVIFPNPRADAIVFIEVESMPGSGAVPRELMVEVNDATAIMPLLDRLSAGVRIAATALGADERVRIRLSVGPPFLPVQPEEDEPRAAVLSLRHVILLPVDGLDPALLAGAIEARSPQPSKST